MQKNSLYFATIRAAVTKYCIVGGSRNRTYFPKTLDAESARSKCQKA